MPAPPPIPIFDGHNDVLLRLYKRASAEAVTAFLDCEEKGQLDLAKARQGGFAGGLFAMFVPPPSRKNGTKTAAKNGHAAKKGEAYLTEPAS